MKRLRIYILLLALVVATTAGAQTVFTLQDAITSACQNNNELQKKRLSTESMKHLKKELFTKYFPTARLSATGFMRNTGFAEGSSFLDLVFDMVSASVPDLEDYSANDVEIMKYGVFGGLRVVQPIYTGGRLTSANRLAKIGVEASGELTALKENELTQEVEKYFWQLVQLYEAERSLTVMDSLVDKAQHDASLALKAGLVTSNDEMQVKLYGSKLESTRLQVENGKNLCREYLAYLLGVEKVDSLIWEDIYTINEPDKYYTDPDASLLDRHELKLLQLKLNAAKQHKKYVLGGMLPTIGALFTLSYHHIYAKRDGGMFNGIFDPHSTGWVLAGNISVPITAWWGGKHALSRSNISIREAQMDFDDKQKLMRVQVSQKWNTLNEKYKQVDVAQRQLEQAEQNRKQQASAYRSGSITMTDRLQADALYEKSRTNYIDACVKYRLAITDYLHATGR